jgi:acetyltransferase-like isoleucine patch superfamily enzyme
VKSAHVELLRQTRFRFCYGIAGHGACIHACTIEDDVLIGMGALVLDGAKVQSGS